MGKVFQAVIAIVAGVGGAFLVFWVLNCLIERLPEKWEERLKPYVFIGPGLFLIGLFLLYPLVRTIIYSFFDANGDDWVGLENYTDLLGSDDFRQTLINNLLWILIVPPLVVGDGARSRRAGRPARPAVGEGRQGDHLRAAGDQLRRRGDDLALRLRGPPARRAADRPARTRSSPSLGFDPIAWVQKDTFHLNTFLLMVIVLWIQVGFAMILLSAAIKGVPRGDHRGGPDRRRDRAADLLRRCSCRRSGRRC